MSPRRAGLILAFFSVLCFSPDALFFRLADTSALTFSFWRGLVAGVVYAVAVGILASRGATGLLVRPTGYMAALAVLNAIGTISLAGSLSLTSVGNTLAIMSCAPVVAALFSRALLGERLPPGGPLAIAGVALGVAFVVSGSLGGSRLLGDLLAAINTVSISLFLVLLRARPEVPVLPSLALGFLLTAVLAVPFVDWEFAGSARHIWALASGGVVLPLGMFLAALATHRVHAAEVALMGTLQAVIGPLLVWIVLFEAPPTGTLIGGAVMIASIALYARATLRPRAVV